MGFLGAGAIIKGKGTVRGITTAAGLWVVTGMGLSIGAGVYLPNNFSHRRNTYRFVLASAN